MDTKTMRPCGAIAATPSKWMRPALVTLALSAVLVLTGCNRSDDSQNHDPNHREGNHRDHPMNGNK